MKKMLFVTAISMLTMAVHAQQNTDATVAAVNSEKKATEESLLLKEEVHDFGKIPQGKPVNHEFIVTNTGKSPLKIVNVQASCGCTTPEWEKDKEIASGADSRIKVGYNAASEGAFTKYITITYNENQTKQITIKGEVWKTPASSAPENTGLNDLKN